MKDTKPTITFDEFGRDGNIFAIAGAVKRAYQRAGCTHEWNATKPDMTQYTYDLLLARYADMVTFVDDDDDDDFDIWESEE
ncbi:MAG: hypothetical protein M3440_08435 [Chloroflexota bacterium]|nr:hypothetical protein [Chloroflexota bacterium]